MIYVYRFGKVCDVLLDGLICVFNVECELVVSSVEMSKK